MSSRNEQRDALRPSGAEGGNALAGGEYTDEMSEGEAEADDRNAGTRGAPEQGA